MSTDVLAITVHGRPIPQGSLRSLGTGRPSIHSNAEQLHPWRDSIITATQAAMRQAGWERTTGPISVHGSFYFDRPKAHYTSKGQLKRTAPCWPTTRANGDLDRLARAVGDSITAAGAIKDDSQLVAWNVLKTYVRPRNAFEQLQHPGVVLELRKLTP